MTYKGTCWLHFLRLVSCCGYGIQGFVYTRQALYQSNYICGPLHPEYSYLSFAWELMFSHHLSFWVLLVIDTVIGFHALKKEKNQHISHKHQGSRLLEVYITQLQL